MSNKLNLELKQGEDFYRLITLKDETNTPLNLAGFSFAGHIRASYQDALFLSFSFNIKDQNTNPGQVEITLARSLSSSKKIMSRIPYVYDIEMNSGTAVTRIMQGNIILDPEVTK